MYGDNYYGSTSTKRTRNTADRIQFCPQRRAPENPDPHVQDKSGTVHQEEGEVMKANILTLLLVPLLGWVAGCTPLSQNIEHAALRSAGDIAIIVALDQVQGLDQHEVIQIAGSVMAFCESGELASLPLGKVTQKLETLIPVQHRAWAIQVFTLARINLGDRTVDVGRVGAVNVARIKSFLRGVLVGSIEWREERKPKDGG